MKYDMYYNKLIAFRILLCHVSYKEENYILLNDIAVNTSTLIDILYASYVIHITFITSFVYRKDKHQKVTRLSMNSFDR